jgi:hypothetical protein
MLDGVTEVDGLHGSWFWNDLGHDFRDRAVRLVAARG